VLLAGSKLVSCLVYSLALMMEACSSEMSVDFQRTTRRYIPEPFVYVLLVIELSRLLCNYTECLKDYYTLLY
jgi:hypothetical protein